MSENKDNLKQNRESVFSILCNIIENIGTIFIAITIWSLIGVLVRMSQSPDPFLRLLDSCLLISAIGILYGRFSITKNILNISRLGLVSFLLVSIVKILMPFPEGSLWLWLSIVLVIITPFSLYSSLVLVKHLWCDLKKS